MWSGKFIVGSEIKGYDTLLKCDEKIPADYSDRTKEKGVYEFKYLNKTAYNELIL